MLTRKHVLQAAQLMRDYGGLRAGSMEHGGAGLTGPMADPHLRREAARSDAAAPGVLTLSFARDGQTGQLRVEEHREPDPSRP